MTITNNLNAIASASDFKSAVINSDSCPGALSYALPFNVNYGEFSGVIYAEYAGSVIIDLRKYLFNICIYQDGKVLHLNDGIIASNAYEAACTAYDLMIEAFESQDD